MVLNLKKLASISLSEEDVRQLCGWPPPDASALRGTPKNLIAALDNLFAHWIDIVANEVDLPVDEYVYTCEHGTELRVTGLEFRGFVLLVIAGYFECLYRIWLTDGQGKNATGTPEAFKVAAYLRFLPEEASGEPQKAQPWIRYASYRYFYTITGLYFAKTMRALPGPRGLAAPFESFAHDGLLGLFQDCFLPSGQNELILSRRLMAGALEFAQHVYAKKDDWNAEHRQGAFSALRLEELAPLARRSDWILDRYGRKRAEKVFEHQLALVFQSFGFVVVSTRTGQSTVDLICISTGDGLPYTVLVEAKSTKAPYALPKKDARALRDYVRDVKENLSTLPPLGFVLLVSHACSSTLPGKLKALESECGCPIRFVRAQQLADLRERTPGPLPLQVFAREVLNGEMVLNDGFAESISSAYLAERRAHEEFVQNLFVARGVLPATNAWGNARHELGECHEDA